MKTKTLIVSMIMITLAHSALGATCSRTGCNYTFGSPTVSNCKNASWLCATNGIETTSAYATCDACNEGYDRVEDVYVYNMLNCDSYEAQASMITHKCEKSTTCGSDCVSSAWVSPLGGYQVRTAKTCVNGTCESAAEFRCNTGWYGTPTTVGNGCTQCPSTTSGDIKGTTAGPGAKLQTECFLPAGTAFSDSTGSGKYSAPCYW